jgi:hypothetical protein
MGSAEYEQFLAKNSPEWVNAYSNTRYNPLIKSELLNGGNYG